MLITMRHEMNTSKPRQREKQNPHNPPAQPPKTLLSFCPLTILLTSVLIQKLGCSV